MTEAERLTRWMVFQYFRETGRAPDVERLSRLTELAASEVRTALEGLERQRQLSLGEDHRIVLAHPFSGVPTPYQVETPIGTYTANCAWDALAIPPLLGTDGRIVVREPGTEVPLRLEIRGGELRPTTTLIHFVVPARNFWDDIGFT